MQTETPATKTYTERFAEMEKAIAQLSYVVNFQSQAITGLLKQLDVVGSHLEEMNMVRKSVNAMMQLSEAGQTMSLTNVAAKVLQLEKDAARTQLANDLAAGTLEPVEEITDENHVIDFLSMPENEEGLSTVNVLTDTMKAMLIGKKVGDSVKYAENSELILKAVYRYNLQPQENSDVTKA